MVLEELQSRENDNPMIFDFDAGNMGELKGWVALLSALALFAVCKQSFNSFTLEACSHFDSVHYCS